MLPATPGAPQRLLGVRDGSTGTRQHWASPAHDLTVLRHDIRPFGGQTIDKIPQRRLRAIDPLEPDPGWQGEIMKWLRWG